MKGLEIVASLKGIVNTTSFNTLSRQDKVAIRSLLDILNQCLFTPTYQVNGNVWPEVTAHSPWWDLVSQDAC